MLFPLLYLGMAYIARSFVNDPASIPVWLQYVISIGSSLATCTMLLWLMEKSGITASDTPWNWDFCLPVMVWAVFWGRLNFINFFYYDEFNRFLDIYGVIGFSPASWFRAVNDHFQPVTKFYWFITYSLFRGEYFGVAWTGLTFAVGVVVGVQALLKQVVGNGRPLVVSSATCLLAATAHSPQVILWKGAGDCLMLSLLFCLMTLTAVLRMVEGRLSGSLGLVLSLNVLTVYSSSQVTLFPLFLVPIGAWVWTSYNPGSAERRTFAKIFLLSAGVTASYWLLRTYVAGVELPDRPFTVGNLWGSVHGTLDVYFSRQRYLYAFVAVSAAAAAAVAWKVTRRSELDRLTILWGVGMAMLFSGVAQLVAARGMTFDYRLNLTGYHLYLPQWGIGLAAAAALLFPVRWFADTVYGRIGPWVRFSVAACAFVICGGYLIGQYAVVRSRWPIADSYPLQGGVFTYPMTVPKGITKYSVIAKRREFLADLAELIDSHRKSGSARIPLPDLPLTESPHVAELALWPMYLNTHPVLAVPTGKTSLISRFRLLLREEGGEAVTFASPAPQMNEQVRKLAAQPHFVRFYEKYWPARPWIISHPAPSR